MLQIDKTEYYAQEKDNYESKLKNKRYKLQSLTFIVAMIRFFLIGMVELNTQMNAITGNRKANTNLWTASFSFLLFG